MAEIIPFNQIPSTQGYIANLQKMCESLDFRSVRLKEPGDLTQDEKLCLALLSGCEMNNWYEPKTCSYRFGTRYPITFAKGPDGILKAFELRSIQNKEI